MTFAATANCVLYHRQRLQFFADVRRRYAQPGSGASRETNYSSHTTVLAVDYAGHPADLDAMKELSASQGGLIEDACHALGAEHKGPARQIADMTGRQLFIP